MQLCVRTAPPSGRVERLGLSIVTTVASGRGPRRCGVRYRRRRSHEPLGEMRVGRWRRSCADVRVGRAAVSGRRSRNKGQRGEREVRDLLRAHGFACERDGSEFGDLRHELPGLHCEVKRCERVDLHGWWAQAVRDAGPGETPSVWFRRSREGWRVVVPAEFLLGLLAGQRRGRICHGDADASLFLPDDEISPGSVAE